jgi:hypothetical protein
LILSIFSDPNHTGHNEDIQEEFNIVCQSMECPSMDENKQKHDWERIPDWRTRRAILQGLGIVFHKVRDHLIGQLGLGIVFCKVRDHLIGQPSGLYFKA